MFPESAVQVLFVSQKSKSFPFSFHRKIHNVVETNGKGMLSSERTANVRDSSLSVCAPREIRKKVLI